jgi:hypothetical protein
MQRSYQCPHVCGLSGGSCNKQHAEGHTQPEHLLPHHMQVINNRNVHTKYHILYKRITASPAHGQLQKTHQHIMMTHLDTKKCKDDVVLILSARVVHLYIESAL